MHISITAACVPTKPPPGLGEYMIGRGINQSRARILHTVSTIAMSYTQYFTTEIFESSLPRTSAQPPKMARNRSKKDDFALVGR